MSQNGVFRNSRKDVAIVKEDTLSQAITVLALIRLAAGKTERDLLKASDIVERDLVSKQPGVRQREMVRKVDGGYLDIVQFRSQADMDKVVALEMESPVCHQFFAVMDMDIAVAGAAEIETCASLATCPKI
jgi:general stress protein 26